MAGYDNPMFEAMPSRRYIFLICADGDRKKSNRKRSQYSYRGMQCMHSFHSYEARHQFYLDFHSQEAAVWQAPGVTNSFAVFLFQNVKF